MQIPQQVQLEHSEQTFEQRTASAAGAVSWRNPRDSATIARAVASRLCSI